MQSMEFGEFWGLLGTIFCIGAAMSFGAFFGVALFEFLKSILKHN